MLPIKLTLPPPPSANRYWRIFHNRAVLSEEARAYREIVARAYSERYGDLTPWPVGPVSVTLHWFRARRSGDLDNRIKVLLDALQGLAYLDDKQVVELHAYRHDDKANPHAEVTVVAAVPDNKPWDGSQQVWVNKWEGE